MRVAPLRGRRRQPVGLVLPGNRGVIGEWTGTTWADVPTNARLYCRRKSDLFGAFKAGECRMRVWRGVRITGFDIGGERVTNLRGVMGDLEPAEALHELVRWADWLRSNGANVGSLSGSSWSLWRASIGSVFVTYGDEPDHSQLVTGGRQGDTGPGIHTDVDLWDLTAAYAHTIGELAVPTQWRRYPHHSDRVPAEPSGYARAAVRIGPNAGWGPLPERIGPGAVSWPDHVGSELEGVWSFDELREARRAGHELVITEVFTSSSHRLMFRDWWRTVEAGRRELDGPAGRLVKACSNTLWGKFLTGGTAEWWHLEDGELVVEPETWKERPKSPALAGLVSGRVRARLYAEALTKVPVISCHTDGVIVPAGHHLSPNTGAPGRWRVKDRAVRLELLSAQSFRYRRADGTMVYRVSGVPPHRAPEVFTRLLRPWEHRKVREPAHVIAERESWDATLRDQWDRAVPVGDR